MRPPDLTSGTARSSAADLVLAALLKRAGSQPPLGVRIAPPGAGAGAGRVDQHEVDAAGSDRRGLQCAPRGVRTCTFARAGAFQPRMDRREPALVGIGGVDLALVLHHGRERQRLAAARPRTDRRPARRAARPRAKAASCEPSSWISTWPLMKAGSDWIAGLFASGATRMRRPHGRPAGLLRIVLGEFGRRSRHDPTSAG